MTSGGRDAYSKQGVSFLPRAPSFISLHNAQTVLLHFLSPHSVRHPCTVKHGSGSCCRCAMVLVSLWVMSSASIAGLCVSTASQSHVTAGKSLRVWMSIPTSSARHGVGQVYVFLLRGCSPWCQAEFCMFIAHLAGWQRAGLWVSFPTGVPRYGSSGLWMSPDFTFNRHGLRKL